MAYWHVLFVKKIHHCITPQWRLTDFASLNLNLEFRICDDKKVNKIEKHF